MVQIPRKDGFDEFNFTILNRIRDSKLSDDIQQVLSRMVAYDEQNTRFNLLLSDADGRLLVSSGATKTSSATNSVATVGVTSTLVLAANPDRKQYMIQNLGSTDVYIELDNVAVLATGIVIPPRSAFIDDIYTGIIHGISSIAAQDVRVLEWT